MAINTRYKRSTEFSMASMSDLIFLLLIFFIITSTLVSPNAVPLVLPNSKSKTLAKQNITVYINDKLEYYVEKTLVTPETLEQILASRIEPGKTDATVVLRADKIVPIEQVVVVTDAINGINDTYNAKHKLILATLPKK